MDGGVADKTPTQSGREVRTVAAGARRLIEQVQHTEPGARQHAPPTAKHRPPHSDPPADAGAVEDGPGISTNGRRARPFPVPFHEHVTAAEPHHGAMHRLHAIIDPALAHLALDDLLCELLSRIRAILVVDAAAAMLITDDGKALVSRCALGMGETCWRDVRVPIGAGFAGRVAAECRPIVATDLGDAALLDPVFRERGICSLLGVPLVVAGRAIGVLQVGTRRRRRFTVDDTRLLQLAADRITLAAEHSRLYEAEQAARAVAETARWRLNFLVEASALLAGSIDYATTLANVARLAVPVFADHCTVDMIGDDGRLQRLAVAAISAEREALLQEFGRRYPPSLDSEHPIAVAIRTGRSLLKAITSASWWASIARDAEHLKLLEQLGTYSRITVPLMVAGRAIGALSFCVARRRYGPDDVALAEEIARRASTAIANARRYEEAVTTLRVHDEVFSAITHDLAQPLTSIRTLAYVLQDVVGADTPDALWVAGRLDATATKMTSLVREILDLARLEAGKPLDLHHRPVDLVALVRQQVEVHLNLQDTHQIRVEASVPELVGMWDAFRLERVVGNLLSNAIKYSPEGNDILVTVSREQGTHAGAARDTTTWAQVTVQDYGLGIPADEVTHIFERFYRARNVVGRFKGNGLGLAGSRQIVEQHGGAIMATSAEGRGSTFTVRLPLG